MVIEEEKASRKTRKQGPYPCDSCDHVCKSKSDLTKHKKGVHGETGGSEVSCAVGSCFVTRLHLPSTEAPETVSMELYAMSANSGQIVPFAPLIFLQQKNIKTTGRFTEKGYHIKKHRGEFSHTCTQCGKKLVTKKGLEVHIKMLQWGIQLLM